MKNFLSALVLIAALPFSLSAQSSSEADEWLARAAARFGDKGVEIHFTINEENAKIMGKLMMQDGRFFFDTNEMKVWFDGKTQWTLQSSPNEYTEVYIAEPSPSDQQSINPYVLLSNYKNHFMALMGAQAKGSQEIILKASDKKQELKSIRIYLKDNGEIRDLRLIFPDEREYNIHIRTFHNGLTIPSSTFVIPSPKINEANEVIDMR